LGTPLNESSRGKAESFVVEVPEKTATRVIVRATTKTDVTIKITNKK